MQMRLAALLFALSFSLPVFSLPALAQSPAPFEFVAIGDMPYVLPKDYERFDRVIAAINTAKPAFTIHVGDIKSGSSPCPNLPAWP